MTTQSIVVISGAADSESSAPKSKSARQCNRPRTCHNYDAAKRFDDQLAKVASRARKVIDKMTQTTLLSHHELGELVIEADQINAVSTRREARVVLAESLCLPGKMLDLCAKLAQSCQAADLREWARPPLSLSHVRVLLNHGQLLQLRDWAVRIAAEELSVSALEHELRGLRKSQRPGSGRRPSPPKSLPAAVGMLQQTCTAFRNKFEFALFGSDFDLATEVLNTPSDQLTLALREELSAAIEALESIGHRVQESAERLKRDAIPWIDQVIETAQDKRCPTISGSPELTMWAIV